MYIDVAVSLDVASLPPAPAGDYSVTVDITEDTWCGANGARLRTFTGLVTPGSEERVDGTPLVSDLPSDCLVTVQLSHQLIPPFSLNLQLLHLQTRSAFAHPC